MVRKSDYYRACVIIGLIGMVSLFLSACGTETPVTDWPAEGQCIQKQRGPSSWLLFCTYNGRNCIETWNYGRITGFECLN